VLRADRGSAAKIPSFSVAVEMRRARAPGGRCAKSASLSEEVDAFIAVVVEGFCATVDVLRAPLLLSTAAGEPLRDSSLESSFEFSDKGCETSFAAVGTAPESALRHGDPARCVDESAVDSPVLALPSAEPPFCVSSASPTRPGIKTLICLTSGLPTTANSRTL
jgi:hypothetical protein